MSVTKEEVQKIILEAFESMILPQLEGLYQGQERLEQNQERLEHNQNGFKRELHETALAFSEQVRDALELIGFYFNKCAKQEDHKKLKERVEKLEDIVLA